MDWRERLELRRRYQEILPAGMQGWAELCWDETPPDPVKLGQAIVEWSGRTVGPLTRRELPGGVFWSQEINLGAFRYVINQVRPFELGEFIGVALYEFLKHRDVITPD